MALAALIFANWRAWPALCRLPALRLPAGRRQFRARRLQIGGFQIPVQFINMLPYVLTVVLLAGFIGKSVPPKASRHSLYEGPMTCAT